MKDTGKIFVFSANFILFILLLAVSIALNAYVLATLWRWFIVTTFALPALEIEQALGVSLVISFLTYHYRPRPKIGEDSREMRQILSFMFLRPLLALGFGWIYLQFV